MQDRHPSIESLMAQISDAKHRVATLEAKLEERLRTLQLARTCGGCNGAHGVAPSYSTASLALCWACWKERAPNEAQPA